MENLIKKMQERISVHLIHITISNPRTKGGVKKVIIRPVQLKNEIYYQKSAVPSLKLLCLHLLDKEIHAVLLRSLRVQGQQQHCPLM